MGGSNAQTATPATTPAQSPSSASVTLQNNPNPEIRRATLASPSDIANEYRLQDLEEQRKQQRYETLANFITESTRSLGESMQPRTQQFSGMPPMTSGLSGNRALIQFQPLSPIQAFSAQPELYHKGIASGISSALGGLGSAYAAGRK